MLSFAKNAPAKRKAVVIFAAIFFIFMLAVALLGCSAFANIGDAPSGEEKKQYEKLANYSDGRFANAEPVVMNVKKIARSSGFFRFIFKNEHAPRRALPKAVLSKSDFSAEPDAFSVRWLGHSTLIFELGKSRFITDPVFGNAAPLPWIVRRYTASPVKPDSLRGLDFILISHDHYDHLEYAAIRELLKFGKPFVVPLGVGSILRGWGTPEDLILELNWGESVTVANVKITAVPSRHFSGRTWSGRDRTLWAAFIFEAGGKKVFFGADGGYGRHFAETGKKYGPFDLACLEIDAWNERWPNNHMFPDEVIKAFNDIRGGHLLPIHWGVFDMAMHPWDESIEKVTELADKAKITYSTPIMGEKIVPGVSRTRKWWRKTGAGVNSGQE